jgi:hypothetical protein
MSVFPPALDVGCWDPMTVADGVTILYTCLCFTVLIRELQHELFFFRDFQGIML